VEAVFVVWVNHNAGRCVFLTTLRSTVDISLSREERQREETKAGTCLKAGSIISWLSRSGSRCVVSLLFLYLVSLDTMSRSKIIIMHESSDGSDEEIPEPSPFSSSFVSSSEIRSQLEASAANMRFRQQDEDSIEESSESQEASKPPATKKQKVEPPEGGQDEEESSSPQKSEQECLKTHKDEATPRPVSAAKELKVADQEQEQAKESPSDQNEQESSPSKEEATDIGVSDAMEFTVAGREQEQDEKPFSEQSGQENSPFQEEDTRESDVLLCDEEQEEDSFSQESGEERSQYTEASRTSSADTDGSARDEEQEAQSSLGQSEQEPSPSSEADEAISVLAALKALSRDEEEHKEELGVSKRKPKAKQFFDDDIGTDDDEKRKRKPTSKRHFDNVDRNDEENEREQEKDPRQDTMSSQPTFPTFPEQVHLMVTETAATQPELIDWVHDGKAFVILDPVRKYTVIYIVVPSFAFTHLFPPHCAVFS
jgi:hypothetical protein